MKPVVFPVILGVLFVLACWARLAAPRAGGAASPPAVPARIVSLAPSITETLYALGLGERVAGVTRFCVYPPEARDRPRVAGFGEVSLEAVLRCRPDLVALPRDKERNRRELAALGLAVLPLDTRSLAGLLEAVATLGAATGHGPEAARILRAMEDSRARAARRAAGRPRPRVLFVVMHGGGAERLTEIHAVGRDGFYSELLRMAGGVNVYAGTLAFPRLSREAIAALDPQVIIDVVPEAADREAVRRSWADLTEVAAIREGRLHLLTDRADTVPGPRVHATLTRLSRLLHPDGEAR